MRLISGSAFRYALVGLANTLFSGALLFVFLKYVEISKPFAVGFAFVIAMTFQYVANRTFTFRSSNRISKEFSRYLTAALLNYAITLLVIFVALDHFKLSEAWASLLASAVTAVSGYMLALLWVYKE